MTGPMNVSTVLNRVAPITLDAQGNGVAVLSPGVTEYWSPTIVRVATSSKNTPVPYVAVFHGSVSAATIGDATTFLDDTATGSNDTSSIIAGVVVQFGESVTARFVGGNPGDNAFLILTGIITNYPPVVGTLPQVPGAHFSGKPGTEVVSIIAQSSGPNTIASGNTSVGNVIDVRPYASYDLIVNATTIGASTGYNPIEIDLFWTTDQGAQNLMYFDFAEFFADSVSGAFVISLGAIAMQDIMHGPYMRVNFTNNSAADTVSVLWKLVGSTRVISEPYAVQQSGADAFLHGLNLINIGANAVISNPLAYSRGRGWIRFSTVGQPMTFNFQAGSKGTYDFVQVAAGGVFKGEIVMPKRALNIVVANGPGAGQYNVIPITQYDKVG